MLRVYVTKIELNQSVCPVGVGVHCGTLPAGSPRQPRGVNTTPKKARGENPRSPAPGYSAQASRHHETSRVPGEGKPSKRACRTAPRPNFMILSRNANTRQVHAQPLTPSHKDPCPSSSTTIPLLQWLMPMTPRTNACGWRCPINAELERSSTSSSARAPAHLRSGTECGAEHGLPVRTASTR